MKKTIPLALVTVLLAGGMARAADAPKEHMGLLDQYSIEPVAGEYEALDRQLDLTDAQRGKLREIYDGLEKDLVTWEDRTMQDAGKIDAYMRQVVLSSGQHDQMIPEPPEVVAAWRQIQANRQKIVDAAHTAVWKELTQDQRATWAGFLVQFKMAHRLKVLTPTIPMTQAQRGQIERISDEIGKDMAAGGKDWTGAEMDKTYAKAMRRIVAEVVVDSQLNVMVGIPNAKENPYLGKVWD